MVEIKKTDHTKCWQGHRATVALYTAGRNIKWYNYFAEKQSVGFLKITMRPSKSIPAIHPREVKAYVLTNTFT